MTAQPPFGPGFTQAQAEEAATMDIAHSSFKDDGDEYSIFILKDPYGNIINSAKIEGY
jgi:hypothetical protein